MPLQSSLKIILCSEDAPTIISIPTAISQIPFKKLFLLLLKLWNCMAVKILKNIFMQML